MLQRLHDHEKNPAMPGLNLATAANRCQCRYRLTTSLACASRGVADVDVLAVDVVDQVVTDGADQRGRQRSETVVADQRTVVVRTRVRRVTIQETQDLALHRGVLVALDLFQVRQALERVAGGRRSEERRLGQGSRSRWSLFQ
mgnify:CR=1 FL=1